MALKYQIFVSSTFTDLQVERNRVIQGILELGHIPVGMEMFSAADEEQWAIIARHIDESDYYVVLLAHHYGSIVDGISYTRKEYEYAVSRGVPVIGFVIEPGAEWPADRVDTEPGAVESLKEFKQLVARKPIGRWSSANDLYGKASVALVKAFAASPRTGWVRATESVGGEVAAEVSRLSAENSILRSSLEIVSSEAGREYGIALDRDLAVMRRNSRDIYARFEDSADWVQIETLNLARIFDVIGDMMMIEASVEQIAQLIVLNAVSPGDRRRLHYPMPMPRNGVGAVLADLRALDLIAPSTRKHVVKDTNDYWALSERGIDMMKRATRDALEQGIARDLRGPREVDGNTAEVLIPEPPAS